MRPFSYRHYTAVEGQSDFLIDGLSLLPFTSAPPEEQLRVFVNGEELTPDDWEYSPPEEPLRLHMWDGEEWTSQYWRVVAERPDSTSSPSSVGMRFWRLHNAAGQVVGDYVADNAFASHERNDGGEGTGGGVTGVTGFLAQHGLVGSTSGVTAAWMTNNLPNIADPDPPDGAHPRLWNAETGPIFWQYTFAEPVSAAEMRFSRPRNDGNFSHMRGGRVEISLDGVLWFPIARWLNRVPSSNATSHASNQYDLAELMIEGAEDNIVGFEAGIRLEEPLSAGDEVIILRETRSDISYVAFTSISPLNRDRDVMMYYNQRLHLLQEWCELAEVADLIGQPIGFPLDEPLSDAAYSVSGEGVSELDIADLNLLPSIVGPPQSQLEVVGVIGNAETELSYVSDTPSDYLEYTLDGSTVMVDPVWENHSIRVRRRTRIDRMWMQLKNASTFSSTQIRVNDLQLQFLLQESCGYPNLPDGHPLANTIFPRPANFLVFTGPGNLINFGQFGWPEGGGIFVFVNDIPLNPEDYDIDWFNFEIVIPDLQDGDVVVVQPGGGGGTVFGSGNFSGEGNQTPPNSGTGGPPPQYDPWDAVDPPGTVAPFVQLAPPAPDGLTFIAGYGLICTHPDGRQYAFVNGGNCPGPNGSTTPSNPPQTYQHPIRSYTFDPNTSSWSTAGLVFNCGGGGLSTPAFAQAIMDFWAGFGDHPMRDLVVGLRNGYSQVVPSDGPAVPTSAIVQALQDAGAASLSANPDGTGSVSTEQFISFLQGQNPFLPEE